LNKKLVCELAKCEYINKKENIIAVGNSGMGKTHIAIALGILACQQGFRVGYFSTAALTLSLLESYDEKKFLRMKQKLFTYDLLILDELGYVPLSKTGSELLFDIFAQVYEQRSIIITTNLPFTQWTGIFGCEHMTGALIDRLTHHVHILQMSGTSYRLDQSRKNIIQESNGAD
jgi:DNA replication protein DnaC